jgi:hypothetical protein
MGGVVVRGVGCVCVEVALWWAVRRCRVPRCLNGTVSFLVGAGFQVDRSISVRPCVCVCVVCARGGGGVPLGGHRPAVRAHGGGLRRGPAAGERHRRCLRNVSRCTENDRSSVFSQSMSLGSFCEVRREVLAWLFLQEALCFLPLSSTSVFPQRSVGRRVCVCMHRGCIASWCTVQCCVMRWVGQRGC